MHALNEEEYAERLINTLNEHSSSDNWEKGDDEDGRDNDKTADIVNHDLGIAIEIKDDERFAGLGKNNGVNMKGKARQIKRHTKDASKKFSNYPNYRTFLLIRSKYKFPAIIKKYLIGGSANTFLEADDDSTENVGGWLIWGTSNFNYIENTNPNVSSNRKININDLQFMLGRDIIEP